MNENQPSSSAPSGSKLSTIFLIVLGLHLVLIVAFSAYYLLKGDTSVEAASPAVAEQAQTEGSEIDSAALPMQPVLETGQETTTSAAPIAAPADPSVMPMPSSNDPIWTRVPEPAPRVTESVAPAAPAPAPVVRAPAPASPAASRSHTVAKGDSLAKIARIHGVSVAELKSANGLQTDLIRIGQVLSIPAGSAATEAPRAVPVTTPEVSAPVASTGNYTVAKGDTLWGIARKLGVSAQELARINGLSDPSKLKIGTVLKVPAASGKQEMAAPVPAPTRVTDMAMAPGQG